MLSVIFQSCAAILIHAIMETVKRQMMVLSAIVQQDILVNFVVKVCSPIAFFHKIVINAIVFALFQMISEDIGY